VSASDDSTVYVWNAETGMIIGEPLQGYTASVNSVVFSSDGKRIVAGSDDQRVHIWKNETLTDSDMLKNTFSLSFFHLNSDGWICGTDSSLLLWIPPEYRSGLMLPHMQILISRCSPISLDLSNFVHGKDWVK
ncbi:hypothetical protein BT96DRAFT_750505, partial [Gymnopus androsaceus JB14]